MWSRSMHQWRDLYIYLPPGYTKTEQYPIMIYLHPFAMDERTFLRIVPVIDEAIASGKLPPMIVAALDGSIDGGCLGTAGQLFPPTRPRGSMRISCCKTCGTLSSSVTRFAPSARLTFSPASRWVALRRTTTASVIAMPSASSSAFIRRSTCGTGRRGRQSARQVRPAPLGLAHGLRHAQRDSCQLRRRVQGPARQHGSPRIRHGR